MTSLSLRLSPLASIFSKAISTITLAVLCGLFAVVTHAQDQASFTKQEVSKGIFMLSAATGFTGGNIAVIDGSDGVMLIDTGIAEVGELLAAEIQQITKKPINYLVNTHVHGDHIGNNSLFGEVGTTIVSHRNLKNALLRDGVASPKGNIPANKNVIPTITFSDQLTLMINDDSARLIHLNAAHTDGDSMIFFENANVIHTGDILFNTLFPYIDAQNGGSLNGVIAALKKIMDIGDTQTKVIPGHGPLASKMDIANTIAMLLDSKSMVGELVSQGKTDLEILSANPLSKYQQYSWNFINTERMTKQIIAGVRSDS